MPIFNIKGRMPKRCKRCNKRFFAFPPSVTKKLCQACIAEGTRKRIKASKITKEIDAKWYINRCD